MIVFVVVLAALVFFYLLSRLKRFAGAEEKLQALEEQVERLTGRVAVLETRSPEAEAATAREGVRPAATLHVAEAQRVEPPSAVVPASSVPAASVPAASVSASYVLRPRNTAASSVGPVAQAPPRVGEARISAAVMLAATIPAATMPAATMPAAAIAAEVRAAAPPKPRISLEERLGHNWLNKLGIVILVSGLVLLLGYQMRALGAAGKSALGLVLSGAILLAGFVLERRERYRILARAALGGGWALLYFVTFGLFHVPAMQVLHSQTIDLVLMLAVAAGMVVHSLRYRSQVVTSLAFLLGFFTVSISHVTLFSLVASAILAAGLVAVAFRERWFVLQLCGLGAVYLNHFLWLQRVLPGGGHAGQGFAEFLPSIALLLFYWLLFRLFYIFLVPKNEGERVCSTLNVLLNSTGLLALLKYQSTHPEWAFRGLLALGIAELVLAFVARRRHHQAFVTLSCIASVLLLAAVPFHFAGSSWSLGWLLEAELLFVAGLSLHETVFRRLGILSAFAAVGHLLVVGAVPVFELRQSAPDLGHYPALAIAFVCAALAAWFNAEFATRRWPHVVADEMDHGALRVLSYAALLCAGVAAWLALAGPWTVLLWLGVALLLAFAADRLRSMDLAQQADVLACAALARAAIVNFTQWDLHAPAPRTVILLVSAGLLYAQMRRKQPAHVLAQQAIAPAYTWAAAGLLATLQWYALQPAAVAVAWCLSGTVLLELGLVTRKSFFRHQGVALLAASFARLFFINIALEPAARLYTMLPLALLYAYGYQRLYASEQPGRFERLAGAATAWFALGTVAALLYFSLRPAWVAIGGAGLVVVALLLARLLGRPLFRAQAMALIVVTAGRALAFNVLSAVPLSAGFTEGRIFTVAAVCAVLFAALPMAYALRKQPLAEASRQPAWFRALLAHPEQVLFFAALAVLFGFVPMQLRAGMITIGWSVLGLLTFVFALAVGERSFRLCGLGLLLLGVGKILAVDVWHASPIDRYITLIVMGAALLLVSFLYSRYRETILKLL